MRQTRGTMMDETSMSTMIHFGGKPFVRWNGNVPGGTVAIKDDEFGAGFTIFTDQDGLRLWVESIVDFAIREGSIEQMILLRDVLNDYLLEDEAVEILDAEIVDKDRETL